MADIFHKFLINAQIDIVFDAISTSDGLATWWTKRSSGSAEGAEYELPFGPEYNRRAKVIRYVPNSEFELKIVQADEDWTGSRVGLNPAILDNRTGLD